MLLVILYFVQAASIPQNAAMIPIDPLCTSCQFVRSKVLSLDKDHAVRPRAVAMTTTEVLLTPDAGPYHVMRFSRATGKYIGNVGRIGQGPGEFVRPLVLHALAGDSLFVYDEGTSRYTVLTPLTYRHVQSVAVQVSRESAAIYDQVRGIVWVAAAIAGASQVGFPIHQFRLNGQWIRSIGSEVPSLRWRQHLGFARLLSVAASGTVWSVTKYGPLTVEAFSAENGSLRHKARYQPSWLPALPSVPKLGDPPVPERTAFWARDSRQLWIGTLVPAKDWQRGLIYENDPTHGANAPMVGDIAKLFDTIVEVFDLDRMRVVSRVRLDEAIVHALPGPHFVLYSESSDGTPQISIERWALRGNP